MFYLLVCKNLTLKYGPTLPTEIKNLDEIESTLPKDINQFFSSDLFDYFLF